MKGLEDGRLPGTRFGDGLSLILARLPAGLRGITPCAASCGYGGNEPALSSPAPKQISADIDNYLRLRG